MPASVYDFKAIRQRALEISRHSLGDSTLDRPTFAECDAASTPRPSILTVCTTCGGRGFIGTPQGQQRCPRCTGSIP